VPALVREMDVDADPPDGLARYPGRALSASWSRALSRVRSPRQLQSRGARSWTRSRPERRGSP